MFLEERNTDNLLLGWLDTSRAEETQQPSKVLLVEKSTVDIFWRKSDTCPSSVGGEVWKLG